MGEEPYGAFFVNRHIYPSFRDSLEEAARKLRRPECSAVLSDFHDGSGRTLEQNLAATGMTPDEYLAWLYFYPGDGLRRCEDSRVLASTSPGSRVIFICETQFHAVQRRDHAYSAHTLIHEMLHALGLGENPPTPGRITQRVMVRCGE